MACSRTERPGREVQPYIEQTQSAQDSRTACKECTKAVRLTCVANASRQANIGKRHQSNG
jgi:hypothetical protein